MKERPILFNTEMVKAVLSERKTQTRRVIKPDLSGTFDLERDGTLQIMRVEDRNGDSYPILDFCPYGKPSERLWVRETWNICEPDEIIPDEPTKTWTPNPDLVVVYRASSKEEHPQHPEWGKSRWKPSIHMPRWASRILLEITDVRVERVQDITDGDVAKEGVAWSSTRIGSDYGSPARDAFHDLWNSINEKRGYSWNSNPWVWVVEFQRSEE